MNPPVMAADKPAAAENVPAAPLPAGGTGAGAGAIEGHLRTLPATPGVYRMLDAAGTVLYVGKAKNLRRRVAAYTKPERLSVRIRRMIAATAGMVFVNTHTEAEALLLEANLIKHYKPRYNILLRDDKSFPSIRITGDHDFPRILKHRGKASAPGQYFGPFASAWAVNETLMVLQRAFLLRTCSDAVFSARTRPCLLYQIKRCAAPCVDYVDAPAYGRLVEQARQFLAGESRIIQKQLAGQMQEASDALDFEQAAEYRDRIHALTRVQSHQDINLAGLGAADVIALHQAGGRSAVQVFFFRAGRNYGSHAYFPNHGREAAASEVLEAFIGQFYQNKQVPPLILVSHRPPNGALLADALSVHAGRRVRLAAPSRGDKRKLIDHALGNAKDALARRLAESASQRSLLDGLAHLLDLDGPPARIEVYDNSHISGRHAVGAMIVATPEGFQKNAYRKFTIRSAVSEGPAAPGDDYAMMREVLSRRFARAIKEDPDRGRGQWPDLVMIDGGKGQLGVARQVFEDLGIEDVALVGVAKGADRDAGREALYLPGRKHAIRLGARDPLLYFIQRLRDEAHRFVIGGHRAQRGRAQVRSSLDGVPGIGPKRKKALLHHFGSAAAVEQAGRADLEAVTGINRATAARIYEWFHGDG